MRIDLDGQVADDVLVDLRLALQLGDERRGRVDLEHDVMRLAVLLDAVGEAAKTPGLGLYDLAAIVLDDLGGAFRQRVDLGLRQVLTREKHMLVQRPGVLPSYCPLADSAPGDPPTGSRLRSETRRVGKKGVCECRSR